MKLFAKCCSGVGRAILFAALAFSLVAVTAARADEAEAFGEVLSPSEIIRIASLLEDPDRYLDHTVKIEGLVDDVCPMKGCWVDVLEEQSETTIRFKVDDDVIVFPAEAKGSSIVAEGILRKRELSHEQAVAWMRHLAEEKGEPFDESTVTGPLVIYQIEGAGAEISGSTGD